jgi:hypothetical protein
MARNLVGLSWVDRKLPDRTLFVLGFVPLAALLLG